MAKPNIIAAPPADPTYSQDPAIEALVSGFFALGRGQQELAASLLGSHSPLVQARPFRPGEREWICPLVDQHHRTPRPCRCTP